MEKFLQSIFSITNTENKKKKLVTILGCKLKFNRGKYQLRLYERYNKKYKITLNRLIHEKNSRKIRVAFYVNDTKWKCQNLYDLLLKSEYYTPFIIVGKSDVSEDSIEYQNYDEIIEIVDFLNLRIWKFIWLMIFKITNQLI